MEQELQVSLYILKIGNTGITWIDMLLICLCPLAGLLGTSVGSAMQKKQIREALPEEAFIERELEIAKVPNDRSYESREQIKSLRSEYEEFINREFRLGTKGNYLIGIALGFVVSLYFFGA